MYLRNDFFVPCSLFSARQKRSYHKTINAMKCLVLKDIQVNFCITCPSVLTNKSAEKCFYGRVD